MKRTFSKFISCLLTLSSSFVLASPSQLQDDVLQRLDKNADGEISIKEAVADPIILESFSRIDINGDGLISRHELTTVHIRRAHGNALN
jgi:Ca2+-binding EF-hand superfamily protein